VGLYRLRGAEGCPPRCPHFFDKEGTPLRITPEVDGEFDALVDLYDEYSFNDWSMSCPPLMHPKIESWVSRIQERGESIIAYYEGTLVGHAAYLAHGEE